MPPRCSPRTPLPDSAAATNALSTPPSRLWGQYSKGRALGAEHATRRWEVARRGVGGRGPEATGTNTGQPRWKLSPLPVRPRPPCSCRRIHDGTERRRGQTAQRASSLRPGPLPAQTVRAAAAAAGVPGVAIAHTHPLPRVPTESSFLRLLGLRIGGPTGSGRTTKDHVDRDREASWPPPGAGPKLGQDRRDGPHVGCKYRRRRCCSSVPMA